MTYRLLVITYAVEGDGISSNVVEFDSEVEAVTAERRIKEWSMGDGEEHFGARVVRLW